MKPTIETKRANGELVGKEVSRQRRWQIRNPEKLREMQRRFDKTPNRLKYKNKNAKRTTKINKRKTR